jgi:hypothetical protein
MHSPRCMSLCLVLSVILFSCQSKEKPAAAVKEKPVMSGSRKPAPPDFDASREVQSAKTIVAGELLLRMLQFDAPYPGFFQELRLYRDGTANTFRNVPDWALQASHGGRLGEKALAEVRRSLSEADLSGFSPSSMPEPSRLHTVLIFFDGNAYQRRNFNGPLPAKIQAGISVVQDAIKAAPGNSEEYRKAIDAAREAERVLRDGSGWNIPKELQLVPLRGGRSLLASVSGSRGNVKTAVYHVLLSYPDGRLAYQPVDPANWPGNPRTELRLTLEHPNEPGGIGITTVTHELVIGYRVLEDTLEVGTQSFPLLDGNLFIIRLDKNWMPMVRALQAHINEPSPASMILDAFKAQSATDGLIQSLRLGG